MNTGNQFLGTERIGKLMRQYAVPCIISLLVGALYNIVDQIFIANASYLGSYGNAANTVVFPLTVVALAIAVMVGDGCCVFVSMALGRGEMSKAQRGQRCCVIGYQQSCFNGSLSYFCGQHYCYVRRHSQRRNVPSLAGAFLLYHAGNSILYVRLGYEPDHSCGRQPQVCHDLHASGR